MDWGLRLLVENGLFLGIATGFLVVTARAWDAAQPFELPKPLPGWFKYWFGSVQVLGIVPPLGALIWAITAERSAVVWVLIAYFVMLAVQVLSEFLTLRRYQTVVWVMVPYLYVPYRLWQLYEGLTVVDDILWLQILFGGEILVWGINYLLDLAQLPRLL
ncbi:hypothetical protein C7271_19050, partial [filamentous cyanobacterium CCP5]